MFNYIEICKVT